MADLLTSEQSTVSLEGAVSEAWAYLASSASTDPAAFEALLVQVFGSSDPALVELLASGTGLEGLNFAVASAEEMEGALGAYAVVGADGTETIYLSETLLSSGDSAAILAVLLEEIGHALDTRLNDGSDTIGDEGELFAQLVLGNSLSSEQLAAIQADVDNSILTIDGQQVFVEEALNANSITVSKVTATGDPSDLDRIVSSLGGGITLSGTVTSTAPGGNNPGGTLYLYRKVAGAANTTWAAAGSVTITAIGSSTGWQITDASVSAGSYDYLVSIITTASAVNNGQGSTPNFSGVTVDNAAPGFSSAATNSSGNQIILTYAEALSATTAAEGAFAVTVAGASRAVSSVSVSESTVVLTLATAVTAGQAVTIAYNDPTVNNDVNAVQDVAGNDAATLGATTVTNNVGLDTAPPTFVSAATSADGTKIILSYNESLDASATAAVSNFVVQIGPNTNNLTTRTVSSVLVSGSTVELTISGAPITDNQAVTVAYADPTGGNDANAIQDGAGNDAASFTTFPVSNNVAGNATNNNPEITSAIADFGFTEDVDASAQDLSDSGSLSFTDIDTNDVIDVSSAVTTGAAWSGGTINAVLKSALEAGFSITGTDEAAPGSVNWTYIVPDANLDFLAKDETITLTYTVTITDNNSATDSQTVTVTITGTNDQPQITATNVTGAVTEDTSTVADNPNTVATETGAFLTGSGSISFTDADTTDLSDATVALTTSDTSSAAPIPAGLEAALANAVVLSGATTDANNGTVNWSFALDNSLVQYLAAGETVTATYTITITDDSGAANASKTQIVTVTITGTNDQPQITATNVTGAVTEDTSTVADNPNTVATETGAFLTGSGSISFTDADTTDLSDATVALTTSDTSSAAPIPAGLEAALANAVVLSGATTDANNGTVNWSFALDNSLVQYLAAGETVTATYTITITDDSGAANASKTQIVTVTITGTNDQPQITATNVTGAVTEDTSTVADNPNTVATETGAFLTGSGSISFTDADTTDLSDATVALTTSDTSSAAPIPAGLEAALANAVVLSGATTDANNGTVNWSFALDNSLVQYLAAGETVTATYTITITDDSGAANASKTQIVTVTITGTNDQPQITATNVTGAVTEDTSTVADNPNTVATETGAFLTGSGSISFTDADTTDLSDATVALTTSDTSSAAPIPAGLEAALANAVVLSGATTDANNGTVNWSFALDNSLVQYLAAGETVTATYTITITDDSGAANASKTQIVTVTITGTNDQPQITATNVTGAVTEDTSTVADNPNTVATETGAFLTGSGSISFTDADTTDLSDATVALTTSDTSSAAPIPAGLEAALANAVVLSGATTDANNGTVNWSFALDNSLVQYLAAGETVTATYTITITDDSGAANASKTQIVTVTITGTNDQPQITATNVTGAVTEDTSTVADNPNTVATETGAFLTGSGSISFTDADTTDLSDATVALTTSDTSSAAPIPAGLEAALANAVVLSGATTDANNGTVNWSFALDNSLVQYLAAGETVTATYTITITDDSGAANASKTQIVTVTITGTNDQPQITATNVTGAVTEDTSTVADNPNTVATETGAFLTGSGSISFTDADTTDLSDATVALTTSDTSSAAPIPAGLEAALANAVVLSGATTDANNGTVNWSFALDNSLVQYLAAGETVTATYTITITDDSGAANASKTQIVTVTITGTNDQPQITATNVTGAVTEDTSTVADNPNTVATETGAFLTGSGSISFTDADTTDLSDATVALTTSDTSSAAPIPAGLEAALANAVVLSGATTDANNGTVNWSFALDNSLVQYLAAGETVTATYTITITDDSGAANASKTQIVTVTITGTNDDPFVANPPADNTIALIRGAAFTFDFPSDLFDDVDVSDTLTYGIKIFFDVDGDGDEDEVVVPGDYGFVISSDGLSLSGTPSTAGLYRVEITADDRNGGTASYDYSFSVMEPVRFGNGDLDQIDFSEADGTQFRLVWTPYLATDGTMKYKLSATNTGNFGLGVAVDSTDTRDLEIKLPELASGFGGFQLRDGSSIEVYRSVSYDEAGQLVYEGEPLILTAADFVWNLDDRTVKIDSARFAEFNAGDADSLIYFVFKLEFELDPLYASGISSLQDTQQNTQTSVTELDAYLGSQQIVDDLEALEFQLSYLDADGAVDAVIGSVIVEADNEFKNARTFNGMLDKEGFESLLEDYGDGVSITELAVGLRKGTEAVTVKTAFDLDPKLSGNQSSQAVDSDGWFASNYAHSGSTAWYTVGVTDASFQAALGDDYAVFAASVTSGGTTLDVDQDGLADFTEQQFQWGGKVKFISQFIAPDVI